ncbi:MAG: hypothetical protein HYV35_10830 [Lentisphaerae bacterium]|nr:hypothetical protein [Lentisphaerota bacterium]
MNLTFKNDWEETRERFRLWWKHDYFGRCALAVTAPKDNPPDAPPAPPAKSPEQMWYDLDGCSLANQWQHSRTFWGGEAFPIWNAGYSGVSALPHLLGCPIELDLTTGWTTPILTDPDTIDFRSVRLDENHPGYQFTMRMLRRATLESRGKSIPCIGAFGGSGDTLAGLRGTEQLLLDCVERPDEVTAAEDYLMEMWCDFYDRCFALVRESAGGSTCWFPLWSPGKFYAVHNDFSYAIGPNMFRELFLSAIRRQTDFLDHSVYHVDGVEAFRHVDALCELPRLQAIQILPGAGKPSPLHYLETLKKVQAAGKNLHITIAAEELEPALRKLSARGLFISTEARSEEEARRLLQDAERWSVDRG